ncbi:HIT domain-containing protein [Candidatus Pelagibacter sp.]|nr:HIT domain-containing protein [Candidatus Pelagibacter sp.]
MSFKLHKKFSKSSHHLLDLKLCTVRLHDNSKFPWIMLIPKRKNINDITDLNSKDQMLLMREIVFSSEVMKKLFKTSKLNVEKSWQHCSSITYSYYC